MTRERPILFNGEMVRAILAGTKTVTRRPVRPMRAQAGWLDQAGLNRMGPVTSISDEWACFEHPMGGPGTCVRPPCWEGDLLYVRETHAVSRRVDSQDPDFIPGFEDEGYTWDEVYYRASPREGLRRWVSEAPEGQEKPHRIVYLDESTPLDRGPAHRVKRWTPSIHMPKWAARIWLRVTSVRVERLQDLGAEDVFREGKRPCGWGRVLNSEGKQHRPVLDGEAERTRVQMINDFATRLWDGTYGNQPGLSWNANPWVWVIEFERVEAP